LRQCSNLKKEELMKQSKLFFILISSLLVNLSLDIQASESDIPWLTPQDREWTVQPLLNVGQRVGKGGYRMVGAPDGLGAMKDSNGQLSIFMNHEISSNMGKERLHGGRGAFVSHWKLDIHSLRVVDGKDLVKQVKLWSRQEQKYLSADAYQFNRLCSADLPALSALFDKKTGKGFSGRIFLNGEEDRNGGRAFAHVVTGEEVGVSYELPHLGQFAWENAVANPATGVKTVVMGMDDSPGGQVYMYVGEKRLAGNPVERAGLVGGQLHALKVQGERFSLFNFGDVSAMNGDALEKAGRDAGVANFMRPEDGAWDIGNPNIFYFATTDKIDGTSQLFQLTFDDINQPESGGLIQVVLNARDIGAQMFDNLTVAGDGMLLIEEDPGDNPHMAAIWQFNPVTKLAKKIFALRPENFINKGSSEYLTQDEENSGVIEVTDLVKEAVWFDAKRRYFLGAIQIHAKSNDPELVEDGQLYLISGPTNH
jgi:hypothetical protein